MTKLVEFIPNFSEGRRQEVIDQISEAAQGSPVPNLSMSMLSLPITVVSIRL